jgi:hypothetical protein
MKKSEPIPLIFLSCEVVGIYPIYYVDIKTDSDGQWVAFSAFSTACSPCNPNDVKGSISRSRRCRHPDPESKGKICSPSGLPNTVVNETAGDQIEIDIQECLCPVGQLFLSVLNKQIVFPSISVYLRSKNIQLTKVSKHNLRWEVGRVDNLFKLSYMWQE